MISKKLVMFVKYLLDFMFYSGYLICFTLPVSFKIIGRWYPTFRDYYIQMCILFFCSGIVAVWIIGELRRIFQTVIQENCFVQENVKSLMKMGILSFIICGITLVRLVFVITPATLIIILVFFIAGLFSIVLSQVFAQAVSYKEENDLTI